MVYMCATWVVRFTRECTTAIIIIPCAYVFIIYLRICPWVYNTNNCLFYLESL